MRRRNSRLALVCQFLLFMMAGVASQVGAQPSAAGSLISREVLFGNPERATARISPDGTQLAYLAPVNGVLNVWVRTLGKTDDRAITADKHRGIRQYFWQFDNQHILYVQDEGGNENWRLYQSQIATKETRDLTPFQNVRVDVLAYAPKFPDTLLIQMNKRDPKLMDVHRVNLKTGNVELDTQNPGDIDSFTADNALQVRAAQVITPDGGTLIRVREDAKSSWRDLIKWGPDETLGYIEAFSPNNRALWLLSSLNANASRLLEVDIATGEQKVLAEDPMFDVAGLLKHPTDHTIQAVAFLRERRDYKVVDASIQADFEVLKKVRDADISSIVPDLAYNKWVVTYVSDTGPTYWYLYDRAKKTATVLFNNQPKLEHYQLAPMKPISYTARDGMKLYGYLTTPVDKEPKNLATVVLVHGGPWGRDVWGYNSTVQWLANRGYAVLQINFRGSAGYGKQYLNAGDRQWAGAMHTDLLDGKQWLVQQSVADAARVCIMGGSYGGYATLAGVAFAPDAFACGVDIVGPSNLVTLLKTVPPYWTTGLAMFHRRMGDTEELLKSQSPLFKADQIKAPLLIGQGKNDPRVNRAESDQVVQAMRKNGKDVEYYVFPDEGHGFARPENRMAFNAATERFLTKHLGGRSEPPTDKESKLLEGVKQ
jgi:dipeptidyl aminopeptidase/acylaminoacyl peptidase